MIHEAAIKVGGRTKAPDYCFRAGGGVRSFFVEAKKPSVDIHEAVAPAYQLRRYAWSAKLPVTILTDFEGFAVYDCRIRPMPTDRASTARILYLKYTDYLGRWDELAGRFSPEAIRKGALDKFVASQKAKKGTAEVDTAFLEEIESWRDLLARNIALRNPELAQRDLNFAVQRSSKKKNAAGKASEAGSRRVFVTLRPTKTISSGLEAFERGGRHGPHRMMNRRHMTNRRSRRLEP